MLIDYDKLDIVSNPYRAYDTYIYHGSTLNQHRGVRIITPFLRLFNEDIFRASLWYSLTNEEQGKLREKNDKYGNDIKFRIPIRYIFD